LTFELDAVNGLKDYRGLCPKLISSQDSTFLWFYHRENTFI